MNIQHLLHQANWYIARSCLAHVAKGTMRLRLRDDVRARRQLAQAIQPSATERRLAGDLLRDGYAILTEVIDARLLDAVAADAENKASRRSAIQRKQLNVSKEFWTRLLDEDLQHGPLRSDNPYVAFAIQDSVVSVLAQVYGELPQLDSVQVYLSKGSDAKYTASQLWHRDHDDTRVIKLYIYLRDVAGEADGPFTFVPGPASDRLGRSLRTRRRDEEIRQRVEPTLIKQMVMPRLSVFMVETSRCVHMGSRLHPGHERLMYMATFISVPRLFPEPPRQFSFTGDEPDAIRYLLTPART
jgi:hypothetical protein